MALKNLVNPVSGDLIMKLAIGVLKEKSLKHIIRILFVRILYLEIVLTFHKDVGRMNVFKRKK
ncbi:hypothetical protein D9C11_02800 [Bacillus subtilis subsp. subtilis]|nr:hypothetical protein D9C11_02800 [Bacillus subtilis subsp. subtilis]